MKSTSGTLGLVLVAAGVLLGIVMAVWLATGILDEGSDLELSGAALGALFCLTVAVIPLIGGGLLIYTRAKREQAAMANVERQRRLLGIVEAAGDITIADLALETGGTRDTVRQDLYDLVSKGLFAGYVDWDRGRLIAQRASELREMGHCPNCGGQLELGGKGMVTCPYCGAEIFLP